MDDRSGVEREGMRAGALSRRDLLKSLTVLGGASLAARLGSPGVFAAPLAENPAKAVRFAVLGDWGSGDDRSHEIARRITAAHESAPLDMVVTAGDNIYPDGAASRFAEAFERPYEALLKKKVPFHACLGNHDVRKGADAQMRYPLFGMGGRRYYSVPAGDGMIEIFMLDSNDLDDRQLNWLRTALGTSAALWKIAVLHHPPFSSGSRHGSDKGARAKLHRLFASSGVRVVFSGHDHVYQRVTLQDGVQYFVTGGGGKVRVGDLKDRDSLIAAGYDREAHFMTIEAGAAKLTFSATDATGKIVDSGMIGGGVARMDAIRIALPG